MSKNSSLKVYTLIKWSECPWKLM